MKCYFLFLKYKKIYYFLKISYYFLIFLKNKIKYINKKLYTYVIISLK